LRRDRRFGSSMVLFSTLAAGFTAIRRQNASWKPPREPMRTEGIVAGRNGTFGKVRLIGKFLASNAGSRLRGRVRSRNRCSPQWRQSGVHAFQDVNCGLKVRDSSQKSVSIKHLESLDFRQVSAAVEPIREKKKPGWRSFTCAGLGKLLNCCASSCCLSQGLC
jgi:hypothetical protein